MSENPSDLPDCEEYGTSIVPDPDSTASFVANLPFKKRLLLKTLPIVASGLVRSLYATNRIVETGREHWTELEEKGQPFLFSVWHETVAVTLPRFGLKGVHALTSLSFDGAIAAALIERFGVETLRGSSSRGGRAALAEMVKRAPNIKVIALTIDGPRGPRRVAKPGMAALSQRTGLPILPIAGTATKSIRLRSWDRTCIPKPFGTYVYAIGEAVAPAESSDRDCIDAKSLELQTRLNELQEKIELEYGIDPQLESSG